MKPFIGINVDMETSGKKEFASVQSNYFDAVVKAGGVPVLIPPMPDDALAVVLSKLDGLMLIGGSDYCPTHYGEKQHPTVHLMEKRRDDFDLRLVRKAVAESTMPILGICAGCQALNIALGGSLIQDIPDEFPQSPVVHAAQKNCWEIGFNKHSVKLTDGSKLAVIYGSTTIDVPTSHHQAVRKPASAFRPVALAEDGVIEAIENPEHKFLLGVQWHPERDYEGNKRLFEAFITAASPVAAAPVR
jgi:gamma-glutamyl-gamma-aminobutyrate hydrolase PuuD